MPQLINCPKCGTLFIKKNRDVCDSCFQKQVELIENITKFVKTSPLEQVHIKTIIEEFDMTIKDFEHLLSSCKFGAIEDKLVTNCTKCNDIMPVTYASYRVCKKCTEEMKKDVLKHLAE